VKTESPVHSPRLAVAELAGSGTASDDRICTAQDAVVVLDGVTGSDSGQLTAGQYAGKLGSSIAQTLTPGRGADLRSVLEQAIAAVVSEAGLEPGNSPSSTVAIAEWGGEFINALVLGDTVIVVFGADGGIEVVTDGRHAHVVARLRTDQRRMHGRREDCIGEVKEMIRATRAAKQELMNRPGGYWIAEAAPEAGRRAVVRSWPAQSVSALMVATDGVTCGPEQYGIPPSWPAALHVALCDGPEELLRLIHDAEAADPDGTRWPRSKVHDDKAVALAVFTGHWTIAPDRGLW
jgi:Protein phosphatase 2C